MKLTTKDLNTFQPQAGTVPVSMSSAFSAEGIPAYMTGTPNAQATVPTDSQTLPMYNAQNGYSDSGASTTTGTIAGAQTGNEMVGDTPGTDIAGTYEP